MCFACTAIVSRLYDPLSTRMVLSLPPPLHIDPGRASSWRIRARLAMGL